MVGSIQRQWNNVTEHTPDDMQEVIFIILSKDDHYNGRMLGGCYLKRHNEFTVPSMSFNASHWMPMPPPPSELEPNENLPKD